MSAGKVTLLVAVLVAIVIAADADPVVRVLLLAAATLAAVVVALAAVGRAHVWPERAEREGAERKVRFAAQMLLGRLRRRRLCAALSTTGSTVWAIEPAGRLALRDEVSP